MTTNWINKVKPWHKKWSELSQEEKDNFYRHNYIHRPENVKRRELEGVIDPMLKVIRNWMDDESLRRMSGSTKDEQAVLSETMNRIKDRNEQLSKARRNSTKSR